MKILAIETSCDETAASIAKADKDHIAICSNVVSSQVKIHARWGGVIPNLAAREHLKNIIPVLNMALKEASTDSKEIDVIAITQGPGLIPALLIGVNAAKTLSYIWNKPLLGIHHIEGHIYANFIEDKIGVSSNFQFPISKKDSKFNPENSGQNSRFPILCIVVSGGHTQLVLMKKHLNYEIIGETLDDAVGEAFDKVARILGLEYPGGPAIARRAMEFPISKSQFPNKHQIQLPRPMINSNNLNFSFSGLKTAVLYETKKHPEWMKKESYIAEMCYTFQQAAIDVLIAKTIKAAKQYHPRTIMLAGGVSANQELRQQLKKAVRKEFPGTRYQIPDTKYSIDNASMIASAAYFRWKNMNANQRKRAFQNWKTLEADANLKLR